MSLKIVSSEFEKIVKKSKLSPPAKIGLCFLGVVVEEYLRNKIKTVRRRSSSKQKQEERIKESLRSVEDFNKKYNEMKEVDEVVESANTEIDSSGFSQLLDEIK